MGTPENKKMKRSITVNNPSVQKSYDTTDVKNSLMDGDATDTVFDPCVEMLIHDYDDERTLDEEEALGTTEDPQAELSDLHKEGDMPLNELLAMYGYGDKNDPEEVTQVEDCSVSVDKYPTDDAESDEPSKLVELYPDVLPTLTRNRLLRSGSRPQSEEEEEDDDGDYSPEEEEWKKTIMVGSDYQAKIPVGLFKYDDALPYENDDKQLWNPSKLTEFETIGFLMKAQKTDVSIGIAHTKDDEQALFLLLQCGYNVEEALRRRGIICSGPAGSDLVGVWSEDECRNFETGIRLYGKDFYTIQKIKVRTRSVGELVQFYYLWKKTERHDVYAHKSRLEKKKFTLHPGITDYMDRFLEEQDIGTNGNFMTYSDNKKIRNDQDLRITPAIPLRISSKDASPTAAGET